MKDSLVLARLDLVDSLKELEDATNWVEAQRRRSLRLILSGVLGSVTEEEVDAVLVFMNNVGWTLDKTVEFLDSDEFTYILKTAESSGVVGAVGAAHVRRYFEMEA